jgi:putative endonuclease
MHHVYLLKSAKDGGFYIGRTDDLQRRLQEHQEGFVESTRARRPLALIYVESYADRKGADERERKLKDFGSAYHGLLKRVQRVSPSWGLGEMVSQGSPKPLS